MGIEEVKIQMTKDNIDYVKKLDSFAKVVNSLVEEMRCSEELEENVKKRITSKKKGNSDVADIKNTKGNR